MPRSVVPVVTDPIDGGDWRPEDAGMGNHEQQGQPGLAEQAMVPNLARLYVWQARIVAKQIGGWTIKLHDEHGDVKDPPDEDARIARNCRHKPANTMHPTGGSLGVELDGRYTWRRFWWVALPAIVGGLVGGATSYGLYRLFSG
ncbi:MAG: hypothetical protein JNM25_05715 [Planctomycetes bacterium]|nr:hypothetical protein [Planctomycetota bacterium]